MNNDMKIQYLRTALLVFGGIFVAGIFAMMQSERICWAMFQRYF